ncbi:hypothetical protein [Fructobacillus ficulneus]|uniref:SAM-dependent methyltransferase n=1 Tax=Fructobacillus ficulneus TaxID=157463 RepID=A0A0K8MK56_9LACO|nr:hypothetical protein [Fructobacillus ficulneus]GAP00559.1 SAM-dependent methyltransferase [Fructobacillus ficulneus]
MQISNRSFIQNILENTIQAGALVLDGAAATGLNTRFLASRVGSQGQVLSFHQHKEDANKTASSLFMAGLQDRVAVINGELDASKLQAEIGKFTKLDLAILDYGSDTDQALPVAEQITDQAQLLFDHLKDTGLLVVNIAKNNNQGPQSFSLTDEDMENATYQTTTDTTYLFEKVPAE